MGNKSFVRFLPVATFINLFVGAFAVYADKKKWWKSKNPFFPNSPVDVSYMLGAYFIGTLWIFKLTYGSFIKYLLTNIIVNYVNAFPFANLTTKVGIFKFKKMKASVWLCITTFLAIIIYGYQYMVEKTIRNFTNE